VFATLGHTPGSLVFDSAGDLFVVSNNQILEFAAGSSSSTVFASSVGVSTTLNSYLAISNEDLVGPPPSREPGPCSQQAGWPFWSGNGSGSAGPRSKACGTMNCKRRIAPPKTKRRVEGKAPTRPFLSNPNFNYFAVVAGVAGVVTAAFLLPFFFDFLVLVALMALPLSLAGAGVGAGVCANEIPATARESARPSAADVIFFMMF